MNTGAIINIGSRKRQRLRHTIFDRGHNDEENQFICTEGLNGQDESEETLPLETYFQKEQFLEKELQPGDTLQTLSIQFNCPISELRRINNILRDNEVFARRIVKIPLKTFSLLNTIPPNHEIAEIENVPSCSESLSVGDIVTVTPSQLLLDEVKFSTPETSTFTTSSLLQEMSQDNSSYQVAHNFDLDLDDSLQVKPLLKSESCETVEQSAALNLRCSGADWGLSWPQLLFCSLLLGFAGPILYVLYLTENPDKKHNH